MLLQDEIIVDEMSNLERAGFIQYYEMIFELSWKLMKDYLEIEEGFIVRSPRQAIKQAFQSGVIDNGYAWIDALEDRNKKIHLYNEEIVIEVVDDIKKKYFVEL